jgi:putative ABC transport system ATP-binding protein
MEELISTDMINLVDITHRRGIGKQSFTLEVPHLKIARGEIVALTGASGSGKSTMLEILGLILKPYSMGLFDIAGHDVASYWQAGSHSRLAQIRAEHLGFVLQTGGLLPYLSVIDNITLSRTLLGLSATASFVSEICQFLGIGHLLKRKPEQLSIGERQRTAIARALAHQPKVLLADEPTAALDPFHADQVMDLLIKLTQELNLTSVIVTHDWDRVKEMGIREIKTVCHYRKEGGSVAVLTEQV